MPVSKERQAEKIHKSDEQDDRMLIRNLALISQWCYRIIAAILLYCSRHPTSQ